MKKIVIALWALSLYFGFAGCSENTNAPDDSNRKAPTTQNETTDDKESDPPKNEDQDDGETTSAPANTLGTLGYNVPAGFSETVKISNAVTYTSTKGTGLVITAQDMGMELTEELMKASVDQMIGAANATDAKFSEMTIAGKTAIVCEYTASQSGLTLKAKAVIFANGSDLYSVTYSGEGSAYTEDELLEVLNSVSFQ